MAYPNVFVHVTSAAQIVEVDGARMPGYRFVRVDLERDGIPIVTCDVVGVGRVRFYARRVEWDAGDVFVQDSDETPEPERVAGGIVPLSISPIPGRV